MLFRNQLYVFYLLTAASVVAVKGAEGLEAVNKLDKLFDRLSKGDNKCKELIIEIVTLLKSKWEAKDFKDDKLFIIQLYLLYFGGLLNYKEVNNLSNTKEAIANRSEEDKVKVAQRRKDLRKANRFYDKVAKEVIGSEYKAQNDAGEEGNSGPPKRICYLYMLSVAMAFWLSGLIIKAGCISLDSSKVTSDNPDKDAEQAVRKYMARFGGAIRPFVKRLPDNPDLKSFDAEMLLHLLLADMRIAFPSDTINKNKTREYYDGRHNKDIMGNSHPRFAKVNLRRVRTAIEFVAKIFGDTKKFLSELVKVGKCNVLTLHFFLLKK